MFRRKEEENTVTCEKCKCEIKPENAQKIPVTIYNYRSEFWGNSQTFPVWKKYNAYRCQRCAFPTKTVLRREQKVRLSVPDENDPRRYYEVTYFQWVEPTEGKWETYREPGRISGGFGSAVTI